MDWRAFIAHKRDGLAHTQSDLRAFAQAAGRGDIPDYQLAAWLMAAYLHPLSLEETAWLTLGMAESGDRLDLGGLPRPWVDKHSTGGVGDKTTLVLLPLLAACGLTVVKMSGRGLGMTGGTIDKLGAVPGFRLDLTPVELKDQAARIGLALTGQTPRLAPADKVLYALRDATATVANVPLIVSSILSKKIAGGSDTILIDVKCGSGAFMATAAEGRILADWLVKVGQICGLKVRCQLTDMSQPLGAAVGNALEVEEALRVLQNRPLSPVVGRFRELCIRFAAEALEACGTPNGRGAAERALGSGAALDKAREWFLAQGAAMDPGGDLTELPRAPFVVRARHDGPGAWVRAVDAKAIAEAVVGLGGGRSAKEDSIDPDVGIVLGTMVGARVEPGTELFSVHAASAESADAALQAASSALVMNETPVPEPPLFLD